MDSPSPSLLPFAGTPVCCKGASRSSSSRRRFHVETQDQEAEHHEVEGEHDQPDHDVHRPVGLLRTERQVVENKIDNPVSADGVNTQQENSIIPIPVSTACTTNSSGATNRKENSMGSVTPTSSEVSAAGIRIAFAAALRSGFAVMYIASAAAGRQTSC